MPACAVCELADPPDYTVQYFKVVPGRTYNIQRVSCPSFRVFSLQ